MPLQPQAIQKHKPPVVHVGGQASPRFRIEIALFLGLAFASAISAEPSSCDKLPLLRLFDLAGLVERPAPELIRLHLNANLHMMDCGAPDGFGTNLIVDFSITTKGARCVVEATEVTWKDWGQYYQAYGKEPQAAQTEPFTPTGTIDLASRSLEQITLRNESVGRALTILPDTFYYYENVQPGADLFLSIEPGGGEYPECCWGATNAGFRFFVADHRAAEKAKGQ